MLLMLLHVYTRKNGKAYSVIDRDLNQPTLVKIPRKYVATRGLLLAIEDGLRLSRQESIKQRVINDIPGPPIISYDRIYPILPNRHSPKVGTEIIARLPRSGEDYNSRIYRVRSKNRLDDVATSDPSEKETPRERDD
jgi:hypothetical protein